ncbi:kelch-like protein 10 [Centroberyx affinis]|uniref:kelch-like protein 10 n=1 Tax=Centroberyx affinis TaxID=166261 RepID=UPI003A5BB6F6
MNEQDKASNSSVFNELRLEGKLCDAVIRVDDVEFNAHKIILCSCSSYFRALFTHGWTSQEQRLYNIPGVSADMMRLLVEFAYTRSVPVTEENVEELLAAADQLCVMGVVRTCCEFLEEQLCPENCIGIWKFVDAYYCPDLRRKAFRFILRHFEEIAAASEEFLTLSLQQLADILERDDLSVRQESTAFEAVLHWIGHSPEERKGHISVLLPKVRLALMTAEYFMNNVKNNTLVKDNTECKPVIINALRAIYDLTINRPSSPDVHPLSRPRLPHGVLLAIGGWSGGSPTNGMEAYDPRADRWVNVTDDSESPRAYHGAAFLDGVVYCVGGFDSVEHFNSVRKFDLGTRAWHQAAPMYERRCYVSVAVLNGHIYAMGGYNGHVRHNTAERYDPKTNQWTVLPPMHEQRSDANATTLYGKVFICGGFNGNECLATAECYDPETNRWTLIADMRSRRSGVGVIAYGEHVYAVGGFDGVNRLSSVEAYNPLSNTWHAVPSLLQERSNFGIEVVDDQLFVVGGFNGFSTTFSVECYDENTGEWYEADDMEIFRSALSCCVAHGLPNMAEYAAPRHALSLPGTEEPAGGSRGSI